MKKISGEIRFERFVVPFRLYGEKRQTIVCLSGAKQTMSAWRSFVTYFRSDYSILLLDMPGQGRAQVTDGSPLATLDEQVDILHALLAELSLSDAHPFLAGGSWGAVVAAAYAAKYPVVIKKLALGSFGTRPNEALSGLMRRLQDMVESKSYDAIAPMMIEAFGELVPPSLKRQILEQFRVMDEWQFQALYEHSLYVEEIGDLSKCFKTSEIECESLVLMGELDTILDVREAESAARNMKDCRYVMVPHVGHFLHWEKPELLALYREFFDGHQVSEERLVALANLL